MTFFAFSVVAVALRQPEQAKNIDYQSLKMLDGNFIYLISAVVAAAGLLYLKRNRKLETGRKYPPSFPSFPIVGSLPFVNGGMDVLPQFFMKTSERLGPVFSFYAGRKLVVVLNGKQAIFDAFEKQSEVFAERSDFWTEINRHNKQLKGLIFAKYDATYRKYHKIVLSILREFGFGVNQESDVRIWRMMEQLFAKFRTYENTAFNPKDELITATSRVFMNIIFGDNPQFGRDISKLARTVNRFVSHVDPAIDVAPMIRFLPRFSKKISIMDECSNEILEVIGEAIAYYKWNLSSDNCFIKRFLEIQGPNYNHQDLIYIVRDMCIGSADTMAVTMTWTLVELANHPNVKARVQKEIDDNVPHDRYPSYDDKKLLPYTEATMLEIWRCHILTPFAAPHATARDTKIGEYFLPKDCTVIANLFSIHMGAELWKDPQNFRPERFLDDEMNIIGKENIVTFSIGKRSCIGETLARHEVFVLMTGLLQHFDLLPPEGMDQVPFEIDCNIAISPKNVNLRLIPRKRF